MEWAGHLMSISVLPQTAPPLIPAPGHDGRGPGETREGGEVGAAYLESWTEERTTRVFPLSVTVVDLRDEENLTTIDSRWLCCASTLRLDVQLFKRVLHMPLLFFLLSHLLCYGLEQVVLRQQRSREKA